MASFPRKRIEEYFELEERRLKLKREADSLAKQQKAIEEDVEKYARAEGAPINKYGVTIYFKEKRGSVAWKEEFIAIKGDKAAEALIKAAPTSEVLVIEKMI
jgi:hypothetical protein